jgi:hypothetical protein
VHEARAVVEVFAGQAEDHARHCSGAWARIPTKIHPT